MMGFKDILYVCVIIISVILEDVLTQSGQKGKIPRTTFSCTKKPSGYYADIETGCEVYHMCDGLGRQFSYKCPNMTLFQQRMLICDHWYMVNCSMSEKDYDANLLIGQRDKPFVSDDEMGWRTPRPDTLSVPPFNPYGDILREDSKIRDVDSNDLDSKQSQNHFRPSNSFSSDNRQKDITVNFESKSENHKQPSLQKIESTEKQTQVRNLKNKQEIPTPNRELVPPFAPVTQATEKEVSGIVQDIEPTHSVIMFIQRFDPNSDIPETAMSKSEIIDINAQLPDGQISSEEERTPKKHKKTSSNFNTLKTQNNKSFTEEYSVNTKSKPEVPKDSSKGSENNLTLERFLLPPKTEYSEFVSTTVGPPIYYEWRWAVPAFDLIPPKQSNETNSMNAPQTRSVAKFEGKNPFSTVTRPEPITTTPEPFVVEYNISSYSVPDYVFPLDKPHPGYDNEDAQTSFQVDVPRPGRASYGENPECPQCHPAYLEPGSCEPCIVKR